jgi:uncharacterized protein (UPF0332 family)
VTPEAARFLQNAENHLERGHAMLGVHLNDDAARAAYLAAFHGAQAVIFERSGRVVKTHRGVQNEFLRLTKDDPLFTPDQRIFLSQAYNVKAVADYETGPAELSAEQATAALERGRGFVDAVRPRVDTETRLMVNGECRKRLMCSINGN